MGYDIYLVIVVSVYYLFVCLSSKVMPNLPAVLRVASLDCDTQYDLQVQGLLLA